jgi:hypothetical protein
MEVKQDSLLGETRTVGRGVSAAKDIPRSSYIRIEKLKNVIHLGPSTYEVFQIGFTTPSDIVA